MGPILIVIGILLLVAGILVQFGALSWFGRLPGDIRIERPSVSVYVPLVSMLIISALLSLIVWVVQRWR